MKTENEICECGHVKIIHSKFINHKNSDEEKICSCKKFTPQSQKINVVGKPMIPSAPKDSGKSASVTSDNTPQTNRKKMQSRFANENQVIPDTMSGHTPAEISLNIEDWIKKHKGSTLSKYNIDELLKIKEEAVKKILERIKKLTEEAKEKHKEHFDKEVVMDIGYHSKIWKVPKWVLSGTREGTLLEVEEIIKSEMGRRLTE